VKRRASFVGARGAEAAYAKLGPGSPRDKQEDELKLAAMECRVREMVLEVTKPTVERAVKLQNHCDHLSMLLQAQGTWLLGLSEEVKDTQSKVDIVSQFKGQMDSFWQDHMNLEVKFEQHKQDSQKQIEQNARHCQSLKTSTELIAKQFERTQEDADIFRKDLFGMKQNVDLCLKRCKDYCDTQMKQMDFKVAELKELQKAMLEEILGPENPNELSPPSLRRFDMQIRQLQRMIKEALEELRHMRLLDGQLQKVTAIQEKHEIRLTGHDAEEKGLKQSLDDLGKELRAQLKRTANLMAAYTSNLMHDVRGSFSKEVDALRDTSQDVQKFLKDTEDKVNDLGVALHGCGKHLEASLREVRTDLEGNDAKRKRDKQGLEESIGSLHKQVFSSKDTSEKMSKGLEHICSVIGMNLQGQRMGIALMVQDYVDRKEVQYVGIKKDKDGSKSERGTAKVIDLQQLSRLPYHPSSVSFQGAQFERPQLLALSEKLVHAAQEVLMKGPSESANGNREASRSNRPPSRQDTPGGDDLQGYGYRPTDFAVANRPPVARPGSRGQPSARGSPILSGDARVMDADYKDSRFGLDDRVSTAATSAKPWTADSFGVAGGLSGMSPPGTAGEGGYRAGRLPPVSTPVSAR